MKLLLIILGSPLWIPLLIAAAAIVFSFFAVIFAVLISLWAVFVSLAACGVAGFIAGVLFAIEGTVLQGIATIGAGMVCVALAIFMFLGCLYATKGIILFTQKTVASIKNLFKRGI